MLVEIKNRQGEIIITGAYESVKDVCEKSKNLSGANLSGADLSGANLSEADLREAYLRGADLSGANLREAYLREAYLRGADLSGANLREAYLRGAYLSGAYLGGADLSGANLSGADLSEADLIGANLHGANLYGVKNIKLPIINISGTQHSIFYMDGKIKIGCIEKTVDEWLLEYEKIGKKNNYTDEQIEEYKKYIDMIAMMEKDKT